MNGRNKYAEQFDRNAGEPADFDSLFRFEKGELITKKRIKMRSSRRRIAAMTITAAAVTAAAVFGLSYLNSSGTSDISIAELAEMSETTAPLDEFLESSSEHLLSEFIKPTDICFHAAVTADASQQDISLDEADIILRCRVITKEYLPENDTGRIEYELSPIEYYYADNVSPNSTFTDIMYVSSDPAADGELGEMQIGDEYIIMLNATDEYGNVQISLSENTVPIRRTAEGWLIDSRCTELCGSAVPVTNDIESKSGREFFLEPSDDAMNEKLQYALDKSTRKYYHHTAEISSVTLTDGESNVSYTSDIREIHQFSEIFGGSASDIFEKVRTEDEDGGTVLVLDNEEYFQLYPHITGTVSFADRNYESSETVMILTASGAARTVIFTGLSSREVNGGDQADTGTLIGQCGSEPIYIRCYDDMGQLMKINIDE